MTSTQRQGPRFVSSIVSLVVVLLAMFAAFIVGQSRGSRGIGTVLSESVKKGRLVSDIQALLLASAEAEKSAVMAETDEASEAYAVESRRASAVLEDHRRELARLIEVGGQPRELQSMLEFSTCWTKYQEVDAEILRLAVENTNLKAQRLSFVAAAAALDRMQAALDTLVVADGATADTAAISQRAYQVLTSALKIYALESRHIAEANDAEMDKLEAQMKGLDTKVSDGLSVLATLAGDSGKEAVATARTAYADFQQVHGEVLSLSRRNSNVRSLAMSLGQKRKVMARCQDALNALQASVHTVIEATR